MAWEDRDYYRGGDGPGMGGSGGGGFGGGGGGGDMWAGVNRFFNRSYGIGTYLGIRVRVHILFILFVLIQCVADVNNLFWTLRWTALLFVSVLLHEFGHALGCRSVGGTANDILLWPLGGLAYCLPPRRPWPQFVTVACGPLVNVVIAAACFTGLWFWAAAAGHAMPVSPHPFHMWNVEAFLFGDMTPIKMLVADLFVVNYALLLFNLCLIFYPFDGGRLVQVALWPKFGYRNSMVFALRAGMVGAVIVGLVGFSYQNLMLLLIAIFGFVTCYRQNQMLRYADVTDEVAYDPGYYNQRARESQPGPLAKWRAQRAARKRAGEKAKEAALLAEVDRILAKVKDHGLQSLSEREKKTLQEATERKKRAG